MESEPAILALAALAQPTRLEAFRLLVRSAPEGLAAGAVADRLAVPIDDILAAMHAIDRPAESSRASP